MKARGTKIKSTVKADLVEHFHPPRRMFDPCYYCGGMVRYETFEHEALTYLSGRNWPPLGDPLVHYCTTSCYLLHQELLDDQFDKRRFFTPEHTRVPATRVRIPIEIPVNTVRDRGVNWGRALRDSAKAALDEDES